MKSRKAFLLVAMLLGSGVASAQVLVKGNVYGGGEEGQVVRTINTNKGNATVTIYGGTMEGSVYGGGLGSTDDETKGAVLGNTTVNMSGGTVERSIYGGGELGSVGTFTGRYTAATHGHVVGEPTGCAENTGLAKVLFSGGNVGKRGSLMPVTDHNPDDDDRGWIFCGGCGENDSITYSKANLLAIVDSTYLEISGGVVTASVYGGCENGLVLGGTYVKIMGGQIGTGYNKTTHTFDDPYTQTQWDTTIVAIKEGRFTSVHAAAFHECDSWDYGDADGNYNVYDIFYGKLDPATGELYKPANTDSIGSNGHSFFGNVFGGGSGYYPFRPGVWRRSAGRVWGDTYVEIEGGHILTSVYGGNEVTDVMGKSTVNMSGGTLGVPRTLDQIKNHPVTCYLFGAGMGDPRILFNTWTNVKNVDMEISGDAFFFGSVFGGGEEGHVLEDVNMTIKGNAWIGTWGRSYVDGNVFGGGRGFSGEALTAGTVGGNVNIDIQNGTMLGSIYGGGRLASVGTEFSSPTLPNGQPNPAYGHMVDGDDHGIITINITGGTIGNDYEAVTHTNFDTISTGGNVFAGSMGRLTKLDGTYNEIWPNLAKVKKTILTINENDGTTIIKGNVYGGGQFGTVTDSTSVNIQGGTIWRDVYGGGYGSHEASANSIGVLKRTDGTNVTEYRVSPMQYAGRVEGNAHITVTGGWIKKCVYGGGELASVGTINDSIRHIAGETIKPDSVIHHPLYLSWPYEFGYANNTGRATVTVKGGRIGITGKDYMGPWNVVGSDPELVPVSYDNNGVAQALSSGDIKNACVDNGDIYGGCKGEAGSTYIAAHLANVNQSVITIKYPEGNSATPENYKPVTTDHPSLSSKYMTGFYEKWSDWQNWITSQSEVGAEYCVAGAVYGGAEDGHVNDSTSITLHKGLVGHAMYGGGKGKGEYNGHNVLTAGKVYGNTHITVNGGYVVRSIFGGGNLASIGKGNYIGLTDGEDTNDAGIINLANASGNSHIKVYGGQIGMLPLQPSVGNPDPESVFKDGIPYGSVFGGSRGQVVSTATDFFGFVNNTNVTIGKEVGASNPPLIYGSVYGGSQDGHVRRNTHVVVNAGEIGLEFVDPDEALAHVGSNSSTSTYWTTRGNVYGGGSGTSTYKIGNVTHYSDIAGSVIDSTNVTINGGLIHRLVYGGGNLASADGHATVNINSPIGKESNNFRDFVNHDYGGYVFGAGRGETIVDLSTFATTGSTEVNINSGAYVPGKVFGGGAMGQVERSTHVNMTGGTVGLIEYTKSSNEPDAVYDGISHLGAAGSGSVFGGGMGSTASGLRDAALVHDSTCVTISGGHVLYSVYGGGEVASVGERVSYTHITNGVEYTDYKPKQGTVSHADSTGFCLVTIKGGQVGPAPKVGTFGGETYNIPVGLNGTDGYVFGGGKGIGDDPITNPSHPYSGQYYEIADVNNTMVVVDMPMPVEGDNNANRLWGSIFGGAEDGHVLGNARVVYKNGLMGTKGTTSYDGNIFGGGRNFSKKNYNAGRVRGNISVKMSGGQLYGSIFGGGRLALTGIDMLGNIIEDPVVNGERVRTYGNVLVKVNGGVIGNDQIVNVPALGGDVPFIETFTEYAMGDVFGGGKGDMTGVAGHPIASALLVSLVRNTEVIIEDSINGNYHTTPKILGSVFGGGEVANVGRFNWTLDQNVISDIKLDYGGLAKVTINGGQIGIDKMRMDYTLVEGDHNYNLKYNTDLGHVFGGGEGIVDNPNKTSYGMPTGINTHDYGNMSLLDLMATVGNTEVSIGETAWVKGSVYGGSMSGHVLQDTKVTVDGGQIGAGYYPAVNTTPAKDSLYYGVNQFINPVTYFGTTHTDYADVAVGDALHECYQWEYDPIVQRPFDPIKIKTETNYKPTNGETWFGSVYGGGSGYYPYIVPVEGASPARDTAIWNPETGRVFGNATVEITGGHILSNVYGGSQTSDVGRYAIADATYHATHQAVPVGELYCISGGKATVTISGGTVGVPTTIESKVKNPINGDVYGGCQGNIHEQLDLLSNVDSTKVTISETAIVYGSVFGGAENGHVVDSTNVVVNGGIIGTTGLSGEDGHVYGGGQGSFYYANLADTTDLTLYWKPGRIGGNTHVKMSDGKVLGCLYGGGSIAVTGVGKSGEFSSYVDNTSVYDSTYHGRTLVELSGGTIGNNLVRGGYDLLMSENEIGNVYGGGRGHTEAFVEDDFGRAANALVKVTGSPVIYGSVFGGGQMANVGHWNNYASWYTTKTGTTSVSIEGTPTIGSELEFNYDYSRGTLGGGLPTDLPLWTFYDTINGMRMIEHTCTGNVYGSGQGDVTLMEDGTVTGLEHGHCRTTVVNINMTNGDDGGHIRGCVFGGAEQGAVWGETKVTIAGGTIGTMGIRYDTLKYENNAWTSVYHCQAIDSTYSYGSVYGGSHGRDIWKHFAGDPYFTPDNPKQIDSVNNLSGRVYGNTEVNITGGIIRGSIYGGGDMASVGIWDSIKDSNNHLIDIKPKADPVRPQFKGNTTVTVSGGEIGPLDGTGLNAYVFGGGKGFYNDPDTLRKNFTNVDSTFVTIRGGKIWGSVFGGANDGHVLGSASVVVHAGADIGDDGLSTWDGNIFGGGRDFVNSNHCNGRVAGNIDITMDGGTIQGSIFGGGRLALTGVDLKGKPYLTSANAYDAEDHGLVTITVSGTEPDTTYIPETEPPVIDTIIYHTSIGNPDGDDLLNGSDESVGDIFGSGKGDTKRYADTLAGRVANTKITISGYPRIYGSVFGGGEMASIGYWHKVSNKQVFYGDSGESEVTIGLTSADNPIIGTDYEYTVDYSNSTPPPDWTVYDTIGTLPNDELLLKLIHTCTGNVFGGSQGDVNPERPHWVSMGRSRKAKVVVNGGTIKSCVYGGAEQGSVATDTYVEINGGSIGSEVTAADNSTYLFGGVFGGGFGSHRDDYNGTTYNNQPITNDSTAALNTAYPNQDLWTANHLAGRVYGDTEVKVLGGTIQGDVYGGANYAYVGGYGASPKGNATTYIGEASQIGDPNKGGTFKGMVFGANNHAGTPFGDVKVHVISTAHDDVNVYPTIPDTLHTVADTLEWLEGLSTNLDHFAIKAVYGGSNRADYTPVSGKNAWVKVYECRENTVYDVYGGSNAANIGASSNSYATNDSVIIEGGRIYRVFGGGNGVERPANIYGSANTLINGGLINQVFGGSNSQGLIDEINLVVNHNGSCPAFIVDEFGGGNQALIIGDVNVTVHCGEANYVNFYGGTNLANIYGNVNVYIEGSTFANIFGGSKGCLDCGEDGTAVAANIKKFPAVLPPQAQWGTPGSEMYQVYQYMQDSLNAGHNICGKGGNVTVNILGGDISHAVYGGCDVNGNVEGQIRVNVIDVSGCGLDLMSIYGAGRDTEYRPDSVNNKRINSPEVNFIHGTAKGSVFGGGEGETAHTYAHPVVNIGYDASMLGIVNDLKDKHFVPQGFNPDNDATAIVESMVFGGADLAQVEGNTTVNVTKANTKIKGSVFGGGSGNLLAFDDGKVIGNDTIRIRDGQVGFIDTIVFVYPPELGLPNDTTIKYKGDVYGGGSLAKVTGDTWLELSGGKVVGNVFAGGKGSQDDALYGLVEGNTRVHVSGATKILSNVYGGGELGSVGTFIYAAAPLNTDSIIGVVDGTGLSKVIISGGEIGPLDDEDKRASVFGGSKGGSSNSFKDYSNVDTTSVILCDSARIYGSVYGGSANGHVLAGTRVLVEKGTNTKEKKPTIGTTGLSGYDGHVYGGGQGNNTNTHFNSGRVGGNTMVEISDGNILGCVFGGGSMGLVGVDVDGTFDSYVDDDGVYDTIHHGTTQVEITGGVIGYPASNNGTTAHNGWYLLKSDKISGNVYGAGRGDPNEHQEDDLGRVAKSVLTISGEPTIYGSVYGGGQMANVGHWLGYIGWYAEGTSVATVNISGSPKIGTPCEFGHDYALVNHSKTIYDTINGVRRLKHTRTGNVYGCGQGDLRLKPNGYPEGLEQGHCGKTVVNISGTPEIMSSVYGGAEQGAVWGSTWVNISGGTIGKENLVSDTLHLVEGHWVPYDPPKTGTYSFGSVFGGSYGIDAYKDLGMPANALQRTVDSIYGLSGRVYGNAYVTITGGTIRENVFGGGNLASVGTEIKSVLHPTVDSVYTGGKCTVSISGTAIVGPLDGTGLNGYVFGGGKGLGDDPNNLRKKYCNVHETEVTVNLTTTGSINTTPENWNPATDGGRVWGSLFGGGSDAHTLDDAKVILQSGLIGTQGITSWDGNIFGGGRNFQLKNYTAGRVGGNVTVEMTGGQLLGSLYGGGRNALTGLGVDTIMNTSGFIQALQDGDDHGKITVMVKGGIIGNNSPNPDDPTESFIESFSASSMGCVYGGGKGTMDGISGHPSASALLIAMVKDTDVQISDTLVPGSTNTRIYGIVFGGGEISSVGSCIWKQSGTNFTDIAMQDGTGTAKVTISGGIIGADRAKMRYEKGDAPYQMYPKYNDDLGYVYGGGEGESDDPSLYDVVNTSLGDLYLLDIMAAVNNTQVTITNDTTVDKVVSRPWVKASVFGGAESGHVLQNTKVTISGGQIGAGRNDEDLTDLEDKLYAEDKFINPLTQTIPSDMYGTYHWDYGATIQGSQGQDSIVYRPYDPAEIGMSNTYKPSDGKSWFGNVFGGGSGWFPYITGTGTETDPFVSNWNENSGRVWGNTEVNITGGHILNNVYGGNESTNVGTYNNTGHSVVNKGKATVKMSGGTVGVPLSATRYATRPLLGYVFGGGAGDERTVFDSLTVVASTDVQITGGIIYGSVMGGSEDGHVKGDIVITVNETDSITVIGSTGQSGYDGNIFGGGRNFFGQNKHSGHVKGKTTINMSDGVALGNVYGGGRNGNVVKSTHVNISGGDVGTEQIEAIQANIVNGQVFGGGLGKAGGKHDALAYDLGNVDSTYVNISDSAMIYNSVFGGGDNGHVLKSTVVTMTGGTVGQWNTLAQLTVDADEQHSTNIYTGNVLGGGKGVSTVGGVVGAYSDTTGIVFGNTTVTISGGTVRHGVYGGGGLSHVGTFTRNATTGEITFTNGGKCTVEIKGDALIGPTKADVQRYNDAETFFSNLGGNVGCVFGAGCGLAWLPNLTFNDSTLLTISENAQVTGSVFGGGENGHVKNNTRVLVSGGTIGGIPLHGDTGTVSGTGEYTGISFTPAVNELAEDDYGAGVQRVYRGNVHGGGKGNDTINNPGPKLRYDSHAGRVYGNSKVEITGGTIYNRVFGGGLLASVGTFTYASDPYDHDSINGVVSGTGLAKVIVSGGTIGTDGNNNGDVFGGGRGIVGRHWEPNYTTCDQVVFLGYVDSTNVTITGNADIRSNVFGGSANGHVQGGASVTVSGGTIGIEGHGGWHSNVYGGGGGQHQYQRTPTTKHHSITSGRVFGNTYVNITNGTIKHNVYGGGAIASVGTYNIYATDPANYVVGNTGNAHVTITGGTIGVDGDENGMVFGSGRGQIAPIDNFMDSLSYVVNATVTIGTEGSTSGPTVHGSVYGSGENGHTFRNTQVNVHSGTIGCDGYINAHASFFARHGNVYGAGCGTDTYNEGGVAKYNPRSGMVTGNTEVNITGGHISHNVYGGGAMALVGNYDDPSHTGWDNDAFTPGSSKAVINITGGTIGTSDAPANVEHGCVFGGSRGPTGNEEGFTNMALVDQAFVNVGQASGKTTSILGNVFGGGQKSRVWTSRVVNVTGGTVDQSVYGGSMNGLTASSYFESPKTVNMRGGWVKGNVFGCSRNANEGTTAATWTSFVNISGGTIGVNGSEVNDHEDGHVFAAGNGGEVNGSVCINIGKEAILQSGPLTNNANIYINKTGGTDADNPTPKPLHIKGNVYGGSHHFGSSYDDKWNEYDIKGSSAMFIDGTGYITNAETGNYMQIDKGVFGCGMHCESGKIDRKVYIRNYGVRTSDESGELTSVSRNLVTIQRGGTVLLDNAQIHFTGRRDITPYYDTPKEFAILQVDKGLFMVNGSSIVMGESTAPIYMDSIKMVKSLYLMTDATITNSYQAATNNDAWEMVGIKNNDNTLYRVQSDLALTKLQENVIVFNGISKLFVRYHDNATNGTKYGELNGFFRMRSPYTPWGTESFAYARPKLTTNVNRVVGYDVSPDNSWNKGDGGFLSYTVANNFFISDGLMVLGWTYPVPHNDGGSENTNSDQYPYYNETVTSKENIIQDMVHRRGWFLPVIEGKFWYVDGRGIGSTTQGWGQDQNHQLGWGHYPDMPKRTITGIYDPHNNKYGGIYNDVSAEPEYGRVAFQPDKDIIFVVGPIIASKEDNSKLNPSMLNSDPTKHYELKLYRYPGGHSMHTGAPDGGTGTAPTDSTAYAGVGTNGVADGPGANLGSMIEVDNKRELFLDNVYVDGLFVEGTYDPTEVTELNIPASYQNTKKWLVTKPMVVTYDETTLTLMGNYTENPDHTVKTLGTVLRRGYNNTDASGTFTIGSSNVKNFYLNPDFNDSDFNGTGKYNGGALYVSEKATVKVERLVTVNESKQKNGSDAVPSNVYLPAFQKSLTMTAPLDATTEIGVTSPIRDTADSYESNTFSPVAVAAIVDAHHPEYAADTARRAWRQGNFRDDQNWFFGNRRRDTYYDPLDGNGEQAYTLYFGWTWANVVREQPTTGYAVDGSNITVSSPEGMAWLINQSVGMHGQTATQFHGKTIKQAADLDMKRYVWVPLGDSIYMHTIYNLETTHKSFAGSYDGQGHLIKNLYVKYIGWGDTRYERQNYGLFGYVRNGMVKRTFVVSGEMNPTASVSFEPDDVYNVGGLVGCLDAGTVNNSETALDVYAPGGDARMVTGGLVGMLQTDSETGGKVHSSMSMSKITTESTSSGTVGGLVGKATGGKVTNAFVNGIFSLHTSGPQTGGLLGTNDGATVTNCYVNWRDLNPANTVFKGIVNSNNPVNSSFNYCYVKQDEDPEHNSIPMGVEVNYIKHFTPTTDADKLGYMYYDNVIEGDTAMFVRLNINAMRLNKAAGDSTYAHWARPGLSEINGDLPVLLLNEFDGVDDLNHRTPYRGTFRSVGTYAHSAALQYGGPVRDGASDEVSAALTREKEGSDKDCLFIYGDVAKAISFGSLKTVTITQEKVSIAEDVSILHAGELGGFANNYVGISFDNSCGHATSTPGVNYGLVGLGGFLLPRDWHMFSTPLSNAPQGFNYQGHNAPYTYAGGDYSTSDYFHNPWEAIGTEYGWLTQYGTTEHAEGADKRYWMKTFSESDQTTDGYFPTRRGDLFGTGDNVLNLFIANTDECPNGKYRYPYGMDFYTWNEPKYHWINFKRNGHDHWHSDANSFGGHDHLEYVQERSTNHQPSSDTINANETTLISGKGYMAAITKETFMQSHGYLNATDQYINVTKTGSSKLPGWNLVGNPFHGYLDFDKVAKDGSVNLAALDTYDFDGEGGTAPVPFYVVYNADKYETGKAETAYRYYPKGGSGGGDYANRFLHPHQGFYVKAKDNQPLYFTEAMLTTRDTVNKYGGGFFRDERPAYPLVNLYLSSDKGCADVTVIELERPHWGGALKLKELRVGDGLFYAQHDNTHFAALFAEVGVDRIPLWFEAKDDDIFTMKWNTANGEFQSMYLIDNITGIQYDMLRNDTYTFEGHKGDYPSRFLIVFNLTGVEENEDEPNIFIFKSGTEWIVTGEGLLQFIDVNGQVLWQDRVSGGQSRVSLPWVADGPYLFRLTNSAETKVQKVIVTKY